MHFFKYILVTSMITLSALFLVGCEGGEADYSLGEVEEFLYGTDVADLIQGDLSFLTESLLFVDDNNTVVTSVRSDTTENITYSIVGGIDKDLFTIDTQTGELSFIEKPVYDSLKTNIYIVVVGLTTANGALSSLPIYVHVVEDIKTIDPIIDYVIDNADATSDVGVITQIEARPAEAGASLQYELTGEDAASFKVDNNGNLSFSEPLPDFASTPNVEYIVSVIITDSNGNSVTTGPITVRLVGDVDDIRPVVMSEVFNVSENSVGNMQIEVQTLGSGTITNYHMSGADASSFTIDNSGKLQFLIAQDYEVQPNSFEIEIVVEDSNGNLSNSKVHTVFITDIDETYTFQHIPNTSVLEGKIDVLTVSAISNILTNVTPLYTMVQGSEIFNIDEQGTLHFTAPAVKGNVYTVQVAVESLVNGSLINGSRTIYEPAFIVTVAVDASLIAPEIDSAYNTLPAAKAPILRTSIITTVTGTIGNESDATGVTYSLTGSDANIFRIDTNGNLYFDTVVDYYVPIDSDSNNIYEVAVEVTDSNGNVVTSQVIKVVVEEDPTKIKPILKVQVEPFSLEENQLTNISMLISAISNADAAGVPSQYLIDGGVDAGLFSLEASTGKLSFKVAPDAESVVHANSYSLNIKVIDDLGNSSESINYSVDVLNVEEHLQFTSLQSFSHVEKTIAVGTVVATPIISMPATMTYTLTDGSDIFVLTSSGALSFKQAPWYDAFISSNNIYTLSVLAESQYNGSATMSDIITVTVLSESYAISFDSDQSTADLNQNTVTSFPMTAASAAKLSLTYSLEEGYDSTIFSINASTGWLTINVPSFIFSNQTDVNIYRAAVVATDTLGNSARRQGVLNVNPIDGIPKFTSGQTRLISENSKALSSVGAISPIGSSLTYTIDGGADASHFALSTAGTLLFANTPNYEGPVDANQDNVYELIVRVTDILYAVNTVTQTIMISVLNLSDAPTNISYSDGSTYVEVKDGTSGIFGFIGASNEVTNVKLSAIPSPSAGTLTYTIISVSPASSVFSISVDSFGSWLKVNTPAVSSNKDYTLTIEVSEEKGETSTQIFQVRILD